MARIRIGTSGWHYDHWIGPVYPSGLPSKEFLAHYAVRFPTVEINSSFYRLPEGATLARWRDAVPEDFVFAVKASRYITHMKKLKDPQAITKAFLERIAVLGDALGPVLFQLPPRWRIDIERLAAFLDALPRKFACAFEFRDRSWLTEEVYRLLATRRAALCIYDLEGYTSPIETTADFVYVRLHGPDGPYRGRYGDDALAVWARRSRRWAGSGVDVFCFFNNDDAGHAARNASRLIELVGDERAAHPSSTAP